MYGNATLQTYSTRKATPKARRETIARRQIRAVKYTSTLGSVR